MAAKHVVLNTIIVAAVLFGFYLVFLIKDVLIVIFIAALFATAIAPLVDRLRSRIGLGQAVLTIYLAIGAGLGALVYFVLRLLVEQVGTLATNLPAIMQALEGYAGAIEIPFLRQMLLDLLREAASAASAYQPTGDVAQGVVTATVSLFTFGFAFFSVLVIAYYWIVERPSIVRLYLSFFPLERRTTALEIWQEVESRLGGWVRGQLILMALIAVMFGVGFAIMGVKYALVLAVFAGVAELIPIFGPWLGSAPAVLVALTQDVWLAIAVAVYAAVVQTLEGNIFVPRVLAGTMGISPLVVLIALLIGISLMGIAGGLLAVPVASAIHVIIQALLLKRRFAPPSKTVTATVPGVEQRDEASELK